MQKKFFVIITHAADDMDRANLAMAFVASMISEDFDVSLLFMFEGVMLTKKGVAETIAGRNLTPLRDLWPMITEAHIPMYACGPCCKTYGVTEADMIEGVKIISAPTAVAEMAYREVVNF